MNGAFNLRDAELKSFCLPRLLPCCRRHANFSSGKDASAVETGLGTSHLHLFRAYVAHLSARRRCKPLSRRSIPITALLLFHRSSTWSLVEPPESCLEVGSNTPRSCSDHHERHATKLPTQTPSSHPQMLSEIPEECRRGQAEPERTVLSVVLCEHAT